MCMPVDEETETSRGQAGKGQTGSGAVGPRLPARRVHRCAARHGGLAAARALGGGQLCPEEDQGARGAARSPRHP